MPLPESEKRHKNRIEARADVHYRLLLGRTEHPAKIEDITSKGLLLITEHVLVIEEKIVISFINQHDPVTPTIQATIVRKIDKPGEDYHCYGCVIDHSNGL